jgi:hypothetical protein
MRDHAEIFISIWDDPDFITLSPGAQRLYFLLLSQRRLEYSGVLPLKPGLWVEFSAPNDEDAIWSALDELIERDFIVLDERTQEVLIRSFFRRDVARVGKTGKKNANLIRAALEACNKVDSREIRRVLVREIYRCAPLPLDMPEIILRFPDLSDAPPDVTPSEGGSQRRPGGPREQGSRGGQEKGERRKEFGA